MHDPMTVAFDIKSPFRQAPSEFWPNGYRPTIITIWHRDPERRGDDDSCGWCYPKLTDDQRRRIKDWAWSEGHYPYFLRSGTREWMGSRTEAETLYRALVLQVARCIGIPMTFDQAAVYAANRIHIGGCEDAARNFCWLPGWHCNGEDSKDKRRDHFAGIMCGIAKDLLSQRRPWYRHPRWHIHHWRLQVHFIQAFKRWAFSRCATCGKRFAWGYFPTTNIWHSGGPRWFRNEHDAHHSDCLYGRPKGSEATP